MDQVEEPLISIRNFNRSNPRWKHNIVLLLFCLALAICLTFYFYLNIQVYKSSESREAFKPLSRRKPILDHDSIFENSGPSLIAINDLLAHCIVALQIAGREVVSSRLNKSELDHIGSKGKTREGVDDIVTDVDIQSNEIITRTIKDSYRRLKIISEEDETHKFEDFVRTNKDLLPIDRLKFAKLLETAKHEIDGGQHKNMLLPQNDLLVWIDPLDATKEYSENLTQYVTLMGCIVHKQTPIAGIIYKPFANKLYWSLLNQNDRSSKLSPDLYEAISSRDYRSQGKRNLRIIVSRSHAGDVENVVKKIDRRETTIISAGGSGYKTIELIKGSVDVYVHTTYIKKWDICAPQSILNSLKSGRMTTAKGDDIEFGDSNKFIVTDGLIASLDPDIHMDLIKHLKDTLHE